MPQHRYPRHCFHPVSCVCHVRQPVSCVRHVRQPVHCDRHDHQLVRHVRHDRQLVRRARHDHQLARCARHDHQLARCARHDHQSALLELCWISCSQEWALVVPVEGSELSWPRLCSRCPPNPSLCLRRCRCWRELQFGCSRRPRARALRISLWKGAAASTATV